MDVNSDAIESIVDTMPVQKVTSCLSVPLFMPSVMMKSFWCSMKKGSLNTSDERGSR